MSAMKGLSDIRSGYFISKRNRPSPFARPVVTYCFCNSSSKIGAQPPDHAGGPGCADHHDRHPQVLKHRHEFAEAPGLVEVLVVHQAADLSAEPDVGEIEQDERQQKVRCGEARRSR